MEVSIKKDWMYHLAHLKMDFCAHVSSKQSTLQKITDQGIFTMDFSGFKEYWLTDWFNLRLSWY